MSVNLLVNGASSIDKHFAHESFLKGRTGNGFNFTGAKGLKILSVQTVPLTDYTRGGLSRYGAPTELQDHVQELIMSQDKSFALTIDKGNFDDQMRVKRSGEMLRMQIDEQVIPMCDKYALDQFVKNAGTIAEAPEGGLTTENVIDAIADACAVLDDNSVPYGERTIFMPTAIHKLVKMSDEFLAVESLADKAIAKGVAGQVMGAQIVVVPNGYLPAGCQFLLAHKNSLLMPWKISDARVHKDPPGINGDLLEGRFYYDAFVLSAKCMGVYALVNAGTKQAEPTIACADPGTGTCTIAAAGADTIVYTLDGSDPRYSLSAMTYTGAIETAQFASGETFTVKAVAKKAGSFSSNMASAVFTVA